MARPRKLRFLLDHNFPSMGGFAGLLPQAELVPLQDVDAEWPRLDDWELYAAIHRSGAWDGLITNDADQLALAKEMVVLSQTTLTLVIAEGEGHQPIRAIGVLLCHLNHICHQSNRERAQIWRLKVTQKNHEEPTTFLEKLAAREKMTIEALLGKYRLPEKELRGA